MGVRIPGKQFVRLCAEQGLASPAREPRLRGGAGSAPELPRNWGHKRLDCPRQLFSLGQTPSLGVPGQCQGAVPARERLVSCLVALKAAK